MEDDHLKRKIKNNAQNDWDVSFKNEKISKYISIIKTKSEIVKNQSRENHSKIRNWCWNYENESWIKSFRWWKIAKFKRKIFSLWKSEIHLSLNLFFSIKSKNSNLIRKRTDFLEMNNIIFLLSSITYLIEPKIYETSIY
jgi:hypothetical protein